MILLTAQPNEIKYIWEVNLYLESVKNIGWEDKAHVLVYCENEKLKGWETIEKLYPKAKFFYYKADHSVINLKRVYLPILRVFAIKEHWKTFPILEKEQILYTDSDIIFTKKPDIEKFLDDDICYVSNTVLPNDYMSHKYFESKRDQVIPEYLSHYDKRDVLKELAFQVGIPKEVIINNYSNTGGAQYLLKNVNLDYWERVYESCVSIRLHLMAVNQQFFPGKTSQEKENNGFQSWCADMWAVLWNLWRLGKNTYCPIEMDFAWATDKVNKLEKVNILHNAGINSDSKIREKGTKDWYELPAFYKGKPEYLTGEKTPFTDIEYVKNVTTNKEFCTGIYAEHIIQTKEKYNLNY